MSTFYDAVDAALKSDFIGRCTELRAKSEELVLYLMNHWWKYKTRTVRCWTQQYTHFRYQTTPPVEGTHSKYKYLIQSSRGGLYTVLTKLTPWWQTCVNSLKYDTAKDFTITPRYLQYPRYHAVVRIITYHTLRETHELWTAAAEFVDKRKPRTECTGAFRVVYGRLRIHELIRIVESAGAVLLRP